MDRNKGDPMGHLDVWHRLTPIRKDIIASLFSIIFRPFPEIADILQACLGEDLPWLEKQNESAGLAFLLTEVESLFEKLILVIEKNPKYADQMEHVLKHYFEKHGNQLKPAIDDLQETVRTQRGLFRNLQKKLDRRTISDELELSEQEIGDLETDEPLEALSVLSDVEEAETDDFDYVLDLSKEPGDPSASGPDEQTDETDIETLMEIDVEDPIDVPVSHQEDLTDLASEIEQELEFNYSESDLFEAEPDFELELDGDEVLDDIVIGEAEKEEDEEEDIEEVDFDYFLDTSASEAPPPGPAASVPKPESPPPAPAKPAAEAATDITAPAEKKTRSRKGLVATNDISESGDRKRREEKSDEPDKAFRRKTTVRYFKQMNKLATFPLTVSITAPETFMAPPAAKRASQKSGYAFSVEGRNPLVSIVPVFPGCACVPNRIDADLSSPEVHATFFLTPLCTGKLKHARVDIRREGKTINRVDVQTRVVSQTITKLTTALVILMPILGEIAKGFGVDLSTQIQNNFPILSVIQFVMAHFGFYIGGAGLISGIVLYFLMRPREADPITKFLDLKKLPSLSKAT
jgi:hypothetical protein